jgi:two-component system sensor histidine kinase MprB
VSLRLRIAALAALGVGVAVGLTALAGYFTVSAQIKRGLDDGLFQRAQQLQLQFSTPDELATPSSDALLAADFRVGYLRFDGDARMGDPPPPLGEPEIQVATGAAEKSVRTARAPDDTLMRVVAVPAGPEYTIVLAQPTAPTDAILERLQTASIVAGGIGIALAAWAGLSIAQTGLRPVRRLTAAAEHVAQTGRLDPIEVLGTDEIARLAYAFNEMLTAVGESQRRQSQLVADAGHELRTPLTSMRTNIDLLAQNEQENRLSDTDRKALISDVRAQMLELSQLIGDLVELSRDEPPQTLLEPVDLSDVVRDAVARARRRAPHITFSVDVKPWTVQGDSTSLVRAVINLLDNAAKYSPSRGTVTVTLREGTLEVSDKGPGIAEQDLPHVFERFYRSKEARGLPGSGLGLAIVGATASRHGGTVVADTAPGGGARLTMKIPGRDPSVPYP